MAETIKAFNRRLQEGFFEKYIKHPGIDIGAVGNTLKDYVDRVSEGFRIWDIQYGDSDATYMQGIPDNYFATVYASHVLEHLPDPITAIQNWFRILAPDGHLIIDVPSMLLYEKKTDLPSRWNADHKTFWVLDIDESDNPYGPHVFGLVNAVEKALHGLPHEIDTIRTLDTDYQMNGNNHASGEYSLEIIVRKPLSDEFAIEQSKKKRTRKPLNMK